MAITTAMPTSFKSELFSGAHCFGAVVITTGNTHTTDIIDGIAGLAGISVGMTVASVSLTAGTIVADIISVNSIRVAPAAISTLSATSLTFTADIFRIALIRHAPVGVYGVASVNYGDVLTAGDEVSGTGYSAGGLALTNVAPTISGTTAFVSFGGTVSWTSATIDSDGCMIYNTANRLGGTSGVSLQGANRAVYVGDFGGRQTVANGTFTIIMPTPDATHAILRLQ